MKNKLFFLESLRGLAAIYVLVHHCRWLLAENYSYRVLDSFSFEHIVTKFLVFFRFGHEAVIFFFVLSGFVIHYSTINKDNSITYLVYLKRRINRIVPPLIFALIITFILDYVGKNILVLSTYSTGSKYYGLVVDNLNWETFIGNIASLQELGTGIKHFGSNAALWSLSYEWWFYILYPIFYAVNKKNKLIANVLQILLFFIFSIILKDRIPIASLIFSKMIIWWLGVVLAELYLKKMKLLQYFSIGIIGIPIAILFFYENRIFGDIFWGIGFLGMLSMLLSIKKDSAIIRLLTKLKTCGTYSYTLYLTHVPIIFFVHSILIKTNSGKLPQSYLYLIIVAIWCIGFAKLTSAHIEKVKIFK